MGIDLSVLENLEPESEADRLKVSLTGARQELQRQRRINANQAKEIEETLGIIEASNALGSELSSPAKWTKQRRKRGGLHATPWLTLSDLHLDEVVVSEQVNGMNEYDRAIALERLQTVVGNTVKVFSDQLTGLNIDGIVCALGGDIITGDIHEELAESNESTVPETVVFWVPHLAAALKQLADTFGRVFVPCVAGNHDRTGKRIRYKHRAQQSFSWIIYKWIASLCADDDRIVFQVSEAPDLPVQVYETSFLLSHGDQFRGGGGVGGIYPPMLKWVGRKRNNSPFDHAVIGHWHQLIYHTDVFVNGSLKGFDEYAFANGFSSERPQQMLFVVTPENGVTIHTAAYAD